MTARLQDLAASFFRHLRAEGVSERTIEIYGQSLRFYSEWLTAQGRSATLEEFNKAAIRAWLAELAEVRAPATVHVRYRGLHRFGGWLVAEDELAEHPMKGLKSPDPKPPPVAILTDDQLAALLKACAGKTFDARRDEVIVRLLLDCGIRVSELTGLTVDALDLDQGMALVRGKGSKVRPIYFGARTARALDRYLRLRSAHRWAHVAELLIGQRGKMHNDTVRWRLERLAELAGIEHLHPHMFRHTFAHDFLMNGGQERDLKRLAGWSSDVMLERYGASAADARAKAAAQRMKRGDRV